MTGLLRLLATLILLIGAAVLAAASWQLFTMPPSAAPGLARATLLDAVLLFLPGVGIVTGALIMFAVARIVDLLQAGHDLQRRIAREQGINWD